LGVLNPLIVFGQITAGLLKDLGAGIVSMQLRSTTWPGDDHVCLEGILGREEEEVKNEANLNPLQEFVLPQPSLPSDILFHGGRRMTEPGWWWTSVESRPETTPNIWPLDGKSHD
jgi:hypothetical protein